MKRTETLARVLKAASAIVVAALALSCGSATGQVVKTAPIPNRNISLAGPQRQGAPAGHALPGTIEGFVYWDAHTITHNPSGSCNGFSVSVTSGGLPVGNASVQFGAKYVGQVKAFLAGGKVLVYDVCTYAYNNVPEGPQLQVRLSVTQPTAFSPGIAPANAVVGSVTVINAQCNYLPNIATATLADLTAHWGSCQNMAYDVNFLLQPTTRLLGGVSQTGPLLLQGSSTTPLLKNTGPNGIPSPVGPGPLSVQSAGSQTSPAAGTALYGNAPAMKLQQTYTGVIRGVVTWRQDGKPDYLAHNPLEGCGGLSVSVSAGPTRIATLNSLQYLGVVHYLSHLDPVCAYAISAPVGQDLRVEISIAPGSFTPPAKIVAGPSPQPIRIPGGQCTQSWSPTPVNGEEPTSGPRGWTCGVYANNVSFFLGPAQPGGSVGSSAIGRPEE
jgi:hypothetical protein